MLFYSNKIIYRAKANNLFVISRSDRTPFRTSFRTPFRTLSRRFSFVAVNGHGNQRRKKSREKSDL